MNVTKIGIVGVGCISAAYLDHITQIFKEVEVIGVCDLIRERAEAAVEKYNIPKLYEDMYELFADPEVEIVLNLTRPYEHYGVSKAALLAGKHVYSEKPLAASLEEGKELMEIARQKDIILAGGPDTFLGAGIQTCRKLIEDGYIGTPIGAAAFMLNHGHESWHPDPEFYYKYGGGPMFDMGPYYLSTMVNLLGNVSEVFAMTKKSFDQRIITSKEHFGEIVDVDVPTYYAGTLQFESGVIGTLFTTFDTYYETQSRYEIYGTRGTMILPDPNVFTGPIKLLLPENGTISEVPLAFPYNGICYRALGLADMAKALRTGRKPRANGDMAFHVLEVMEAFAVSGKEKRVVPIDSRFEPTPLMARGQVQGILD